MGSRRLVVTDLDGTLVGDDAALSRFAAWHRANREEVWLAYATGRTLDGIEELVTQTDAPRPDVAIIQVGTEVYDADRRPWPGWLERFEGWDADVARAALRDMPGLTLQPETFQTRLKASFFAPDVGPQGLAAVRRRLVVAGLRARIVQSSGEFLDVLPPGSGKGPAARAVASRLGVHRTDVLVFGDTANDLDLFREGFRGTVVANALPELATAAGDAYHSPHPHAAGILDGIRHWTGAAA